MSLMLTQCNYSSFECTVHVLQVLVCAPHLLWPKFSGSTYHMSSEQTLPKTTISDLNITQHQCSPVLFKKHYYISLWGQGGRKEEEKAIQFLASTFLPLPFRRNPWSNSHIHYAQLIWAFLVKKVVAAISKPHPTSSFCQSERHPGERGTAAALFAQI